MTTAETDTLMQQVQVTNGKAQLNKNGQISEFEIKELPQKFIRWQVDYKNSIYDSIERDEYVAFNADHLPVVGTWNTDSQVPNLANKGVGFTPKDEYLDYYLKLVEGAVEQIQKLPPHAVNDTRELRIKTAREFYRPSGPYRLAKTGVAGNFRRINIPQSHRQSAGICSLDRQLPYFC